MASFSFYVFMDLDFVSVDFVNMKPMRPKAEWAIDSEAMRARGIIVLVKSN